MLLTGYDSISLLLVEDNPSDVLLIQFHLQDAAKLSTGLRQFTLHHSPRLEDALAKIESEQIHVILLDLSLPDSTGIDTFERLNAAAPNLPIIVLTDLVDDALALRVGQAGAQDFLNKSDLDARLLGRSIQYAIARKEAEVALRRSEERYHSLFQNVPIGLYRSTPDGQFLDINQTLRQILDIRESDSEPFKVPAVWIDSEQRKRWEEELLANGEVRNFVNRLRLDNGREVWLESNSRVVQDESGRILWYEGSMQEITSQKLAEQEAGILADIYRSLSESPPGETLQVALRSLSSALPVIYADVLFWQPGEKCFRQLADWIAPDSREQVLSFRQQVGVAGEKPAVPMGLDGVHERAVRNGEAVYIPDTRISDIWGSQLVAQFGGLSSYSLPLALQDGAWAVLTLVSTQADGFSPRHRALLERLRPTFTATVEVWQYQARLKSLNDSLEQRVRQRTAELNALFGLSRQLGYAADVQELGQTLLQHLQHGLSHDVAAVVLDLHGKRVCSVQAARPLTDPVRQEVRESLRHAVRNSPLAASAPQMEEWDALLEGNGMPWETSATAESPAVADLKSVVICPLLARHDGPIVGFLFVAAENADVYQNEQVQLFQAIANHAGSAIARLESSFLAEQQRMADLVAHLPDGVVLVDDSGRIVMANPAAEWHLQRLAGDKRPGDRLHKLGDTPLARLLQTSGEANWHEIASVGPHHLTFEIAAQPMQLSAEEPGWVLVIRDVTDEREHQQRLQKQERLATVGQLAAGIAHDFNNILAVITLYSQMLKQELPPARRTQYLATLEEQSKHAARLIEQILDFSRRSVIERTPVNLLPFMQETARMLQRTLPESIAIAFSHDQPAYTVNCDPTRLQQVLMNLAVNARDAMPNGGQIAIRIRAVDTGQEAPAQLDSPPAGRWVRIDVTDSGSGIPHASQKRIFEPFFTTKAPGEGTGLGLAQVYGIVKQHGGEIEVHSQAGEGTTFAIYLPLEEESQPEIQAVPLRVAPAQQERILLVEDNQATQEAVHELLEMLGYRVLVASNGQQALELCASLAGDVDLVLSDMVMPDLSGVELFHRLRHKRPDIQMVIMTGYPLADNGKALLEEGIVDWVQKPFSIDAISRKIRASLEKRHIRWKMPQHPQPSAPAPRPTR